MKAVAFLGPSLGLDEARRLLPGAQFPGPAKQGDVLRALREKPKVIALVDGVFETQRSVWHQELRIALAEGVRVVGASSMGALRAVELAPFGMEGVGEIFRGYAEGRLVDDADVALLHADAAHGFRALTVPLVNVISAAGGAAAAGALSPSEARSLVKVARRIDFEARDWSEIYARARWPKARIERFESFRAKYPCDAKADDARACLSRARSLLRLPAPKSQPLSSLSSWALGAWIEAQGDPPAGDARQGLRTLLLAEWGRSLGLVPEEEVVARISRTRVARSLDAGLRRKWAEALALEDQILRHPERLLAQAPSLAEGVWVAALRR